MNWLFVYLTIVTFTSLSDGTTFLAFGSCPENVGENDTFTDPEYPCSRCECYGGISYYCVSCGVYGIILDEGCYAEIRSPNASYPDCCYKVAVCPGDHNYDPIKYEDQQK